MRVSFGVLFVVIATISSAKARGKRPAASSKVMPKMVTALAALTTPERNTAYMFHGDQFLPAPDDDKPLSKEEKLECLEAARKKYAENEEYELAAFCRDEISALNGVTPKKRRMSGDKDPGAQTAHESRYVGISQMAGGLGRYLAGSRARTDPQVAYPSNKAKAKAAVAAAWSKYREWKSTSVVVDTKTGALISISWELAEEAEPSSRLNEGMSTARKYAIQYLFIEQFGAPPPEEWDDHHRVLNKDQETARCISLPTVIMRMLNIPAGSKQSVEKAMHDIFRAHHNNELYGPSKSVKEGRGRKPLIDDLTPQAEVVYRTMESGLSLGNTVVLVNQWRRARGMDPLSYGALQYFVKRSSVMEVEKRGTKKSGKEDKTKAWSMARLAFCKQLERQLRKAKRIQETHAHGTRGDVTYVAREDGDDKEQAKLELPLHLDGTVFWDGHHRKVRFGHASKYETRIRRDKHGNYATEQGGGDLPKKKPTTTAKFCDEARGSFGCCIRTVNGKKEGIRLPVFDYTGQVSSPLTKSANPKEATFSTINPPIKPSKKTPKHSGYTA